MFIRATAFLLFLAPNGESQTPSSVSRRLSIPAPGGRGISPRLENVPDFGFSPPLLRFVLHSCLFQRI